MKIVVSHDSPDMDSITSAWLIRRFLPGWNEAVIKFVPAGNRLEGYPDTASVIEKSGEDEVIHVDTGLGPLDHHHTGDQNICAASLTWDFVRSQNADFDNKSEKMVKKEEAINRLVRVVVDIDHFKEIFWGDPIADYQEFSLLNILEGLKAEKPGQDDYYVEFVSESLDAVLHEFENRISAEEEIKKGFEFKTSKGRGIGFETINDMSVKLAQKMGYVLAIRKDPRKGYVRIKARPDSGIDLTQTYEKLKKLDSEATWFLHASKKMLLNGSVKNPKMRPSTMTLSAIIEVLKTL
ncbi:MAG TPA: DHH family phosphoesterase [Patescibacteria group bacterium]|nr:DHH family phosphoesterase [Patescibacteria group bacterium]